MMVPEKVGMQKLLENYTCFGMSRGGNKFLILMSPTINSMSFIISQKYQNRVIITSNLEPAKVFLKEHSMVSTFSGRACFSVG